MSEPLSDVMKRWQDNPQRYGYEGKREDAFRIADAACRLIPELVEACDDLTHEVSCMCKSLIATGNPRDKELLRPGPRPRTWSDKVTTDQITERAEYLANLWTSEEYWQGDILDELKQFAILVREDERRRIRETCGLPERDKEQTQCS